MSIDERLEQLDLGSFVVSFWEGHVSMDVALLGRLLKRAEKLQKVEEQLKTIKDILDTE